MENLDNQETDTNNIDNTSINTCVVGITSSHPYDSSEFVNNSSTFYTRITYSQLIKLYDLIDSVIKNNSTNSANTSNPSDETKIFDMNLLFVADCFKNASTNVIFRFLCSPDCENGTTFINDENTSKVYDFVNLVTKHSNCIIEISDHSMGSFFNNWNDELMGFAKPIEILEQTHAGPFKMYGSKTAFVNSIHPTLKQIGNLSADENVEITFNNVGGTKIYKIIDDSRVKLISKGNQIKDVRFGRNLGFGFNNFMNLGQPQNPNSNPNESNNDNILYGEVPVHSEFDFNLGKIVVSSTHWCNLDSVETPVDIPTLRRYCTDSMGYEATQNLEYSLSSAQNDNEFKRIISDTVRQLSAGPTPAKKFKPNSNTTINTGFKLEDFEPEF